MTEHRKGEMIPIIYDADVARLLETLQITLPPHIKRASLARPSGPKPRHNPPSPPLDPSQRWCITCKEARGLAEFYPSEQRKKRGGRCKRCETARKRDWAKRRSG